MKYTFIGDTPYALFLYLLSSSEEMIKDTIYFVGNTLKEIEVPNKIVMPAIKKNRDIDFILYRLKCLKYRKELSHSLIYAQDHLFFSAPLIDNLPYVLIEDCPNFFSMFDDTQKEIENDLEMREKLFLLRVGRLYKRHRGYNPYCILRLITTELDRAVLVKRNLRYMQINIYEYWRNASTKKKDFILNVFDIDKRNNDVSKRDIVLFSQPLVDVCKLTIEEHINIYKPYIMKYGTENIVVKLHPRDNFDYKRYFPGIAILSTKAPQQLLSLLGFNYKIAITCCSSAVSTVGSQCKVIWIGAEVNQKIVDTYGHVKQPFN